jgi:D-3-phosphoglycerate dehydrogenase
MAKTSFPKQDIRILLLEGISQTAVESFRRAGYTNLEYHEKSLPEAALAKAVAEAHIVGIRSRSQLTGAMFEDSRRLLAVGCFCIGTNQVNLEAAQARGVPVFNAPYSNTRSVAELVIAEAILLMRRIPEKNLECHRGGWSKSAAGSFEVRGKTIGIVGYGHIGTQVGVLAESLGMRVIFYDVQTKLALGNAEAIHTLPDLLQRADIVTLHVPETLQTRNMIGAAEMGRMKPGAVLINASRGTVVDIDALAASLHAGHLAGAAIDVFPVEPKGNSERFESPLVGMDNVILTPHVGGSTLEAQENIGLEVAAKLIRYSDNGSTLTAVNFPEVSLPENANSRRLLHIHTNVPGMLRRVNELFSDDAVNLDAQYLQTSGNIGYVVIDFSASEEQAVKLREKAAAIAGTLRTRLLY